jgi:hypothetical protein
VRPEEEREKEKGTGKEGGREGRQAVVGKSSSSSSSQVVLQIREVRGAGGGV